MTNEASSQASAFGGNLTNIADAITKLANVGDRFADLGDAGIAWLNSPEVKGLLDSISSVLHPGKVSQFSILAVPADYNAMALFDGHRLAGLVKLLQGLKGRISAEEFAALTAMLMDILASGKPSLMQILAFVSAVFAAVRSVETPAAA